MQDTYPVILVSCDCCELGLGEDHCFEVLSERRVLPGGVDVDHVEPWLVPVHRVQNYLKE